MQKKKSGKLFMKSIYKAMQSDLGTPLDHNLSLE